MISRSFTRAELALAYELRQHGYGWKFIARGLGCSPGGLANAIYRATKDLQPQKEASHG